MGTKENKEILKPYLIIVEGKLDKIVVNLVLNFIKKTTPELSEIVENTQVFPIGGKDKLRARRGIGFLINKAMDKLKAIMIVLDKDEDYASTQQQINNFLINFEWIPLREFLIIPDEESEGKNLEDYLVQVLRSSNGMTIQTIEDCIRELSSDRNLGKKVFYAYLLAKDGCNYEGISINEDRLLKCLPVEELTLIKSKIEQFFNSIKERGI